MAEYVKVIDLLDACVEVEYLGRPRMMVSASKIAQLPSVEIPQWIPCDERLPKERDLYICWVINPYDEVLQYHMLCDFIPSVGEWYPIDESASNNVIAWMPLPKCYRKAVKK